MSSITNTVDEAVSKFVANGLELVGTDEFDDLKGSKKSDLIMGLGGSDSLRGAAKKDLIYGGLGKDFIKAGKGSDIAIGGGDDDIILGNKGNDLIDGGKGDDTIFGGKGDDTILGSTGSDLMFGNSGADIFEFNAQNLNEESIDRIGDFDLQKDSLVIKGLSNNDDIVFDDDFDYVYFNGKIAIDLNKVSDINKKDIKINKDQDFELF